MAKRSSILIALSLMTSTFLMGVAVPAGATARPLARDSPWNVFSE